jgi:hypothetical protein
MSRVIDTGPLDDLDLRDSFELQPDAELAHSA